MTILLTGAAGFIGYHTALALLKAGHTVRGIDNLNPYYDPKLKQARLERLLAEPGFTFLEADLRDQALAKKLPELYPDVEAIVHLAAQAGVRHSLKDPFAYTDANVTGHLVILEAARTWGPRIKHVVYASSSSVYGSNTKLPYSVEDRVDHPISLYAATKRCDELMSEAYSHLFGIPMTGLRFFTVYGPWGRPDMSAFIFLRAMLKGEPITVFNHGQMRRNYTYIDDIVAAIVAVLSHPPVADEERPRHRLYNIGNDRSEGLLDFIGVLEELTGCTAIKEFVPLQPGDVPETIADISDARRDFGFDPKTDIREGLAKLVAWYQEYQA